MSDKLDLRSIRFHWMKPADLKDGETVFIHVQGLSIVPVVDSGDGRPGEFWPGKVRRVFDEQENLIGIVIGEFYFIPEEYLENTRIFVGAGV